MIIESLLIMVYLIRLRGPPTRLDPLQIREISLHR